MPSELALGESATAWLTIAVQGGFVVGTLSAPLLNLADVFNARRLFAAGCVAGAAANAAIAWSSDGSTIIALRFATGAALACVYPPGMKIAAGWFLERRGSALGVVVGALTLGSAFPHLLVVECGRPVVADADAEFLGARRHRRRHRPSASSRTARTSRHRRRSIRTRSAPSSATAARGSPRYGYLGHMWELYAMWAWIAAFAAASLAAAGAADSRRRIARRVCGDRQRRGRLRRRRALGRSLGKGAHRAASRCITSGACSAAAGLLYGMPLAALLLSSRSIWGFSVVADSAQFSALVSEYSARTHVGTALTLQTCAGFLLTMVSMRLLPLVAASYGWRWAFLLLVPGPILGAHGDESLRRRDVAREHVST